MCTFKTSPFVPAPRAHMLKHVCACCRYTRRRFERTHGDVLSGHTGFHGATQHTPHRTPHRRHDHNTTRRQRQRQTETDRDREKREDGRGETRQEKRRQKKTREDKRRETIHFQCVGAWPFFVGVVIFLINSVCARDLSLLNSVKYDSSLISFSAPWQVNSFFKYLRMI